MPPRTQTEAHNKACESIGLEISKFNGTTNHGHRHSYGQRMKNAGIDKKVRQVAMHHKSEESQNVYTEPTVTGAEERKCNFEPMDHGFDCSKAGCEASRCLQCDLRVKITPQKFWSDFTAEEGGQQ